MSTVRVEESVEIARAVGDVFTYVTDAANFPEWAGVVIDVSTEVSGPLAAGDTFTLAQKFLGRRFDSECENDRLGTGPSIRISNYGWCDPVHFLPHLRAVYGRNTPDGDCRRRARNFLPAGRTAVREGGQTPGKERSRYSQGHHGVARVG